MAEHYEVEVPLDLDLPPDELILDFATHLPDNRRVLDAGCWLGRHAKVLSEHGHSVTGLDLDLGPLLLAKEKLPDVSFVQATLPNLPFTDESFDAVMCNSVLHLLTKRPSRLAIEGIKRVTKPGGLHAVSGYLVESNTATQKKQR